MDAKQNFQDLIGTILNNHQSVIQNIVPLIPTLSNIAEKIIHAIQKNGTVFWMGNGGSAADTQHMAAELIGRFKRERRAIASIALTTDTSILTSVGNDYGFNYIFSRQLEGLCKPNDVVIGLSTSGNSQNIIEGVQVAKKIGAYTLSFTGDTGGKLKAMTDDCICVPSDITARIQEAHSLMGHILCEIIDNAF